MRYFKDISKKHAEILGGIALIGALGVAATLYQAGAVDARTAPQVPPAAAVSVRTVNAENVRIWSEFSGRMDPVDEAEIRPQVSGRITDIRFQDGQIVHAGDVLMVIDPQPYEAAVAKAQADLESARTNVSLANIEFARAARLVKAQALAQSIYDQRANAKRVAIANEAAAEAQLKQAQIDLDHAYVKAPITGRVSRPEITLGNLVEAGPNAPLLTSIVSNDGIYADFDVDEQTYLRTVHARGSDQAAEIPVELTVQGDGGHVYKGAIYSFDNKINPDTGTIRARARFANTDGSLVPGMFVSVKMGSDTSSNVLLVPDRAISSDQSKNYVYVVDRNNVAKFRTVELGQNVDGQRIILSGLKSGERVIVDGVQHVQPGQPVAVQQAALQTLHTHGAAAD